MTHSQRADRRADMMRAILSISNVLYERKNGAVVVLGSGHRYQEFTTETLELFKLQTQEKYDEAVVLEKLEDAKSLARSRRAIAAWAVRRKAEHLAFRASMAACKSE